MPKAKSNASGIHRIAIDGHFLDETQTQLHSEGDSTWSSYLSAPVETFHSTQDDEGVTLILPALTALQLHHDGVLTADDRKSVELTVAGRPLGPYYIHWMRTLPGNGFAGPVILRFCLKPAKKERVRQPYAWLKTLVPLKLYPQGNWDPMEEYWGEPGEPIEAWAKPIIKRGPRRLVLAHDRQSSVFAVPEWVWPLSLETGAVEEAEASLMRLLWMSPSDNLGVRFLLPPVRSRKLWSADDP
jgi:hypothetical protein